MDFLRHNRVVFHLLFGILLTLVYPLQELFSGNQNIYFLCGVAELLPNVFAADPLLNSPDPYPLFTWLISVFPVRFLSVWSTILYVLLSSVYSFSLFGIADRVAHIYHRRARLLSFAALFLFLHNSPIWGSYFKLVFDIDLRWIWDSGIAEQGVLRGYLQPSVFGVFLLLSLYFALRRNFLAAILSLAPAASIHANYLFLGAMLTVIYLFQSRAERKSILAAALLLLCVTPYSIYLAEHFIFFDEATKLAINQAVMAGFETNLHINPINWLNGKFYLQLFVLVLGTILVWPTRLRNLVVGILGLAVTLTLLAYLSHNTTLISLNPWRSSIILIPISVSILLGKLVHSSFWNTIRPILIGGLGSVCLALIHYRLFGNSSNEFLQTWWMAHAASLVVFSIGAYLFSRQEKLSILIEPALVIALVSVGLADNYVERISRSNSDQFQVISSIDPTSEPQTIYVIPADWTSFRMNAEKAVYVDENLVYGPALPSLTERLNVVSDAVNSADYAQILSSIPENLSVKLIARTSTVIPYPSKKLSDHYSCFTIRQ